MCRRCLFPLLLLFPSLLRADDLFKPTGIYAEKPAIEKSQILDTLKGGPKEEKPEPPKTKTIVKTNQHTHTCPRCHTSWTHGAESQGNTAAHTCPKCGTLQWNISQSNVTTRVQVPVQPATRVQPVVQYSTYSSGCPGGNCPTAGFFRGRRR